MRVQSLIFSVSFVLSFFHITVGFPIPIDNEGNGESDLKGNSFKELSLKENSKIPTHEIPRNPNQNAEGASTNKVGEKSTDNEANKYETEFLRNKETDQSTSTNPTEEKSNIEDSDQSKTKTPTPDPNGNTYRKSDIIYTKPKTKIGEAEVLETGNRNSGLTETRQPNSDIRIRTDAIPKSSHSVMAISSTSKQARPYYIVNDPYASERLVPAPIFGIANRNEAASIPHHYESLNTRSHYPPAPQNNDDQAEKLEIQIAKILRQQTEIAKVLSEMTIRETNIADTVYHIARHFPVEYDDNQDDMDGQRRKLNWRLD